MKLTRFAVSGAVLVSLVAVDAFAQLGSIRGKFVDEDGNPVADLECAIEVSGEGGRRTKGKTKKNGELLKGGVRPGTYTITCTKEGFRPLPLSTQVSAFDQANLGEQVVYRLAPGELSETQHARAQELLEEFNMASESGNEEETLAKLLELQEMMPDSPEVMFNIASTYESMGDKENAIKNYTMAAEKNPQLAYDCHLAIADLHGKDKEWPEASAAMGKAMEIQATDPVAMFNYAVYAQNAGETATAKGAYEKTLAIDPNRALAHYQLALIAVGEQENDTAVMHFEKFLELEPSHPQAGAAQELVKQLKQSEQ